MIVQSFSLLSFHLTYRLIFTYIQLVIKIILLPGEWEKK